MVILGARQTPISPHTVHTHRGYFVRFKLLRLIITSGPVWSMVGGPVDKGPAF